MTEATIPPFPDDVPTAPLLRISLSKLLCRDADEEQRLWWAACDVGFFYLDLRKSEDDAVGKSGGSLDGEAILEDVESLFELGKRVFDRSEAEKREYDFAAKGSYFG